MITRAKIIGPVEGSGGYKYFVNIPILLGKPDSEDEKELFDDYYNNQAKVETNSDDVKKSLLRLFLTRNKQQVHTNSTKPTYDLNYVVEACVCGLPSSMIHYQEGDIVIVGFEDNNMGKPIILGSLLTKELAETTLTKVSLNANTLTADEIVTLPLTSNVTFQRTGILQANELESISAIDIENVVKFIHTLDLAGITASTVLTMLTSINSLTTRLDSLIPTFDNDNNQEITPDDDTGDENTSLDANNEENKTEEEKSE